MIRQMIKIDAALCNGCGICVDACHEGALEIVNGKATIIKDDYCDGLGNCLPVCPTNAITFEMREAPRYDEEAVVENMIKLGKPVPEDLQAFVKKTASSDDANGDTKEKTPILAQMSQEEKAPHQQNPYSQKLHSQKTHQCPGSMAQSFAQAPSNQNLLTQNAMIANRSSSQADSSQLRQWPIQIKLAPVNAAFFNNAHLLIAADCSAYAHGNFHNTFMRNKVTLIGCPKLDSCDYSEKLSEILINNTLKSVTVVRMEVPCCSGMEKAITTALENAYKKTGKLIPWQVVILNSAGNIVE